MVRSRWLCSIIFILFLNLTFPDVSLAVSDCKGKATVPLNNAVENLVNSTTLILERMREPVNPCSDPSLSNIQRQRTNPVFSTQDPKYETFKELAILNQPRAIQMWLLSSPKSPLQGVKETNVGVEKISNGHGDNNRGIYRVSSNPPPKNYILKIVDYAQGCDEFEKLQQLNQTLVAHPECFSKAEGSATKPASIARLVLSGHDKNRCFGLLEMAPGVEIKSILDDFLKGRMPEVQAKTAFNEFGKQLSAFHFLDFSPGLTKTTSHGFWIHHDSHDENVFYDPISSRVTLVDNERIEKTEDLLDLVPDFQQAVYRPLAMQFFKASREVQQKILEASPEISSKISKYDTENLDQLANQVFHRMIQEGKFRSEILGLPEVESLRQYQKLHLSFIRGYMEAVPARFREEIKNTFSRECYNLVHGTRFILGYQVDTDIERIIQHEFKELYDCADGKF